MALALSALALPCSPASSEEPVETSLRQWVAAIDASPDWSARYGAIAYDSASGSATLSDLSVKSTRPGVVIDFDAISVTGFRESDDGGLVARRVVATGGAIAAGLFQIALSDVVLDDFVLPQDAGFAWNPSRPFTSMVKAYGALAKAKIGHGRVGSLTLVEDIDGLTSRISYGNVAVERWAEGKIKRVSAGPLTMETPSPLPLVAMSVNRVVSRDVDLEALIHVYDPDNYAGGIGDKAWRPAVASVDYGKTVIDMFGANLAVGGVSIRDIKVRQPEHGFAALFDAAAVNLTTHGSDPAAATRALDLAGAFSVGRFEMSLIDIDATGFDRLHLDRLAIADLSSDGLGEFAIEGLEGVVADVASLKIGRLACGGMAFPEAATIAAAIRTSSYGGDVDYSSLAPALGFFEIGGVDVDVAGIPPTRLARMRVDLDNYVDNVPTAITLDVTGADVATSMIIDDRVRRLLEGFGYDRVNVDANLKAAWNAADETTVVDDFHLTLADIGTVSGDAVFSGPTREGFAMVDTLAGALDALSLKSGSFTFEDESLVGRALGEQAARLKVDPAKFREQFARGLPFMLTFLGNREFQSEAAPVLQTFIRTPGSISVIMAPAAPIAVSTIVTALQTAPFSLPNLLALSVSGEPGPEPAPLAAEPATSDDAGMRRTLEPQQVE